MKDGLVGDDDDDDDEPKSLSRRARASWLIVKESVDDMVSMI